MPTVTTLGSITITDITDGTHIWTTTITPTANGSNYIFYTSNLSGSVGAIPKVGDVIFYNTYKYTVSAVTGTVVTSTGRTNLKGTSGVSISSATPLYYCSSSSTPTPSAPTQPVSINDTSKYNQWNKSVATYTSTYKYYYICTEMKYSDDTTNWSEVVRDAGLEAANSTASTASTNANAAVTTANKASSTANTASTNASAAVTTANTASSKADAAAKTATNYLKFSEDDGLVVGNQTGQTLTGNVQIMSTPAINLRDGAINMATFNKDGVEFYDNGTSIAVFGASGSTIGKINAQRFVMDETSLTAYNKQGAKYFDVSNNGIKFGAKTVATQDDIENTKASILTAAAENTKASVLTAENNINKSLDTVKTSVKATEDSIDSLEQNLQTANSNIESIQTSVKELKDNTEKYMSFDSSDGLTIGASNSNFKTVLGDDKLSFREKDNEVAYIGSNQFSINNGVIENSLKLGKYAFIPRSDGSISLQWKG